ncbi:MAG TPA: hypothetical protein PKW33_08765 [Anaerolineaceae bacterium]|nr:hypothetical protein [Anaerolineaceae bacterium]HPN51666.1 hypothetical protein [Anaerolineaceae bacterium]
MKTHIQFLPFSAINAFMRDDFQIEVVKSVLSSTGDLPELMRGRFQAMQNRSIHIHGFRNSASAPTNLKIKPFVAAMEKNAELTAMTLQIWAEIHPELMSRVNVLLKNLGWEVLPLDADRTKLPGFLTVWPAGQDFETLNKEYRILYPDLQDSSDDISLMAVWVGGRLPYQTDEESPDEEG